MDVELNGELQTVGKEITIRALVNEVAGQERGVAVAVNGAVLPRAQWDITLADAQAVSIDIITAVQGG
ncbi:sulfur carrier protein ThiS [Corynebacterium freiburgense]|uniref:sulfur carrier protein ThiS n=1 Tax=Corynebacterium freiburgense TaxID=556548 RepID=UPI000416AB58|nr:sulfur carrier protein ThiS [Corynebacterium freiburgense]WJZ03743.1 sulfur carrier protein ThiS [Corynebacterium freiburgense]